jgi:hypothetical protein
MVVKIEVIVAKTRPTRAMSTARPVKRLWENGVVNVQPAIVIHTFLAGWYEVSELKKSRVLVSVSSCGFSITAT